MIDTEVVYQTVNYSPVTEVTSVTEVVSETAVGRQGPPGADGAPGADGQTPNLATTLLTGYTPAPNSPVLDTDSILAACGKYQAQINDINSRLGSLAYLPLAGGTLTGPITGTGGVIEQRNGVTSQEWRNYRTYTDGSNYGRAFQRWNGAAFEIGFENLGTGGASTIRLGTATSGANMQVDGNGLTLTAPGGAYNATLRSGGWAFGGPVLYANDNAYDFGASGANRPRSIYAGTSIAAPSLTVSGLTSGRVPYASTGGLLTDSSSLTWDQTNLRLSTAPSTNGFSIGQLVGGGAAGIYNNSVGTLTSSNYSVYTNVSATGINGSSQSFMGVGGTTKFQAVVAELVGTVPLSVRNGATAQYLRAYNTYTDASNGEWFASDWQTTSNTLLIGAAANGTGTLRALQLTGSQVSALGTGRSRLTIKSDGNDPVITNDGTSANTLWISRNAADWLYLSSARRLVLGSDQIGNETLSFGFNVPTFVSTYFSQDFVIQGHTRNVDEVRRGFYLKGGDQAAAATTNLLGGHVYMQGGAGASGSVGLASGGNVYLDGGLKYGTGVNGDVVIGNTRGSLRLPLGSITNSSFGPIGGPSGAGFWFGNGSPGSHVTYAYAGFNMFTIGNSTVKLRSDGNFGFNSTNDSTGTLDTPVYRDAAGVWARRNGTSPQEDRFYNTFTDASNYERGVFGYRSNVLTIGHENLGTGVARAVSYIGSGHTFSGVGTGSLKIDTAGSTAGYTLQPQNTLRLLNGAGSAWAQLSASSVSIGSNGYFAIGSTTNAESSLDVIVVRDGAGVWAQRNSTNAQTQNLYGTYTDGSNYRRLRFGSTAAGAFSIVGEGLGTGAAGNTLDIGDVTGNLGLRVQSGYVDVMGYGGVMVRVTQAGYSALSVGNFMQIGISANSNAATSANDVALTRLNPGVFGVGIGGTAVVGHADGVKGSMRMSTLQLVEGVAIPSAIAGVTQLFTTVQGVLKSIDGGGTVRTITQV